MFGKRMSAGIGECFDGPGVIKTVLICYYQYMYSMYSKYYDRLNTEYDHWIRFIKVSTAAYPDNSKLIEYGCGTGNMLVPFVGRFALAGVDLSAEMLAAAKEKLPGCSLYHHDMLNFSSDTKYDISLCLFDSINHLTDFSIWTEFFRTVYSNMSENGIFIFDANTTTRLAKICERQPWFTEFDTNYFYMKLHRKSERNFIFDVRILSGDGRGNYREEREEVEETTADGSEIYRALQSVFGEISVFNDRHEQIYQEDFAANENARWFFVCRKPQKR